MKNLKILSLLPLVVTGLIGCNNQKGKKINPNAYNDQSEEYYSLVEERNPFDKSNELNFVDEITNGLDDKVFLYYER